MQMKSVIKAAIGRYLRGFLRGNVTRRSISFPSPLPLLQTGVDGVARERVEKHFSRACARAIILKRRRITAKRGSATYCDAEVREIEDRERERETYLSGYDTIGHRCLCFSFAADLLASFSFIVAINPLTR